MSVLITGILLSLVSVVVCFVISFSVGKKRMVPRAIKLLPLVGFIWLFVIIVPACFVRIEANSVGIIYDELNGGIQDKTYSEGLHLKSVFEEITQIKTSNKTASLRTAGQTNDGQYATFQISIIYHIKTEDAGKFYRITNNTDISSDAINNVVKTCLQSSTIKYNIFELLSTGLETARIDFMDDLTTMLYDKYYVTLVNASFDDIDGGSDVENILQEKAEAEQKIKVAQLTAEANLITAENEAEIKKTLADATSYAITVEGEANGKAASSYVEKVKDMVDNIFANSAGTLTYKESTDLVLSIIFYDTWDGKLPETLTSDSLSSLIGSLING